MCECLTPRIKLFRESRDSPPLKILKKNALGKLLYRKFLVELILHWRGRWCKRCPKVPPSPAHWIISFVRFLTSHFNTVKQVWKLLPDEVPRPSLHHAGCERGSPGKVGPLSAYRPQFPSNHAPADCCLWHGSMAPRAAGARGGSATCRRELPAGMNSSGFPRPHASFHKR